MNTGYSDDTAREFEHVADAMAYRLSVRIDALKQDETISPSEKLSATQAISKIVSKYYRTDLSINTKMAWLCLSLNDRDSAYYYALHAFTLATKTLSSDSKHPEEDIFALTKGVILVLRQTLQPSVFFRFLINAYKNNPKNALFANLLAGMLSEAGKSQEALSILERAHRDNPENPHITASFSNILYKTGDAKKAIAVLESSCNLPSADHRLKVTYGNILYFQGQPKKALAVLQAAYEEEPSNAHVANTLANVLIAAEGDIQGALTILESAHVASPNDVHLTTTLGKVLHYNGHTQRGIEILEGAHKKAPDDTHISTALASIFSDTGNRKKLSAIISFIPEADIRAYMEAKIFLVENNKKKALEILAPHIASPNCYPAIIGMFISILPPDSPIPAMIKATHGQAFFDWMQKKAESWRADPKRMEAQWGGNFKDTQRFYELGANAAVSGHDKRAASSSFPVSVKRTPNNLAL